MRSKVQRLVAVIQREGSKRLDLFRKGRKRQAAVREFESRLGSVIDKKLGPNLCQQEIHGSCGFKVDFYVREEKTIVELECSLSNAHNNFERDIFKALLARGAVSRLVLVGNPGSMKRLKEPGPSAIKDWAEEQHHLSVQVVEMGPPRRKQTGS
jgi:hypothetical protein